MAFRSSSVVDISASVSDMSTYYFAVTAAGSTSTWQGQFRDANGGGYAVPASGTLSADTVYTWLSLYNQLYSTTLTALPDGIVGVIFDHGSNISYCNYSSAVAIADIRKGPTWEAQKNRAVGRNG